MANSTFAFKQFVIKQDKCAMKVSTDAVLLGAWVIPNGSLNILDIGTGTGVIALMLAQKSKGKIHAIDIEKSAYEQAKINFEESIFTESLSVEHKSLQDFAKSSTQKFDLIVTNPPYFVDSLKSFDSNRSNARHADILPYIELIEGVKIIMSEKGKFCLILPKNEAIKFREQAESRGFHLSKLLRIRTTLDKGEEKRHLMQFEFRPTEFSESTLVIEKDERHSYTEEYKNLTKDYYIHF
ncbi:MAG: methyltransferase domain-containing protein [Sphingobacteriaceae bacterium]|nr:methyltransferase domain-containing protein [Sphingobacteriaceae bacterium]